VPRDEVHGWNEFPHQYSGETFGECAAVARKRGWIIRTMPIGLTHAKTY
jgi:hypothetical protein